MSGLYVINRNDGGEMFLLAIEAGVLAFEDPYLAEDYADQVDMPGEYEVIPYEPQDMPTEIVLVV